MGPYSCGWVLSKGTPNCGSRVFFHGSEDISGATVTIYRQTGVSGETEESPFRTHGDWSSLPRLSLDPLPTRSRILPRPGSVHRTSALPFRGGHPRPFCWTLAPLRPGSPFRLSPGPSGVPGPPGYRRSQDTGFPVTGVHRSRNVTSFRPVLTPRRGG